MQIDDYQEAIALTEKLQANLPIKARPTKELIKSLREQGKSVNPNHEFSINYVNYSGDFGGIMCAIGKNPEDKEVHVVSITHLKIDPDYSLKAEVQAYQQKRIRGLKLQNQSGFAAQLLSQQTTGTKKKRSKGFGK